MPRDAVNGIFQLITNHGISDRYLHANYELSQMPYVPFIDESKIVSSRPWRIKTQLQLYILGDTSKLLYLLYGSEGQNRQDLDEAFRDVKIEYDKYMSQV